MQKCVGLFLFQIATVNVVVGEYANSHVLFDAESSIRWARILEILVSKSVPRVDTSNRAEDLVPLLRDKGVVVEYLSKVATAGEIILRG